MTAPGWYPVPTDASVIRYWDGEAWTAHTAAALASQPEDQTAHIRWVGDRVVVPSTSIRAGLVPRACVSHGRPGSAVPISFVSKTPLWVFVTIVAGIIVPIVIALLLRKTVTARAWPVCEECRNERRRNLLWMWVSIGSWLPLLVMLANLPSTLPGGVVFVFLILILLGPLVAAVWFHERASLGLRIGGEVMADGATVSFPAGVFRELVQPSPPTGTQDTSAFFG